MNSDSTRQQDDSAPSGQESSCWTAFPRPRPELFSQPSAERLLNPAGL